ncbi:MAG TPA: Panacea domain-containing protein [Bryobacteraceae bacterium]|nr:Panacea domain-containing protein [Bryobacteraceae bacterium]
MRFRFNEAKATEAAASFLRLRGGRMKYLKLIKLLYIADREALARWGRPISTDRYVSMREGPVTSNVYNLIVSEPMPSEQSIWKTHIRTVADWDVELISDPGNDELSRSETALLAEIFDQHGYKNRWDLVRETHKFPEWKDPGTSSTPITYREILRSLKSSEEASADLEELKSMIAAERIIQPV